MKVKPIDPTAVIRDPRTLQPLPAKGAEVPDDDVYWNRRLIAKEIRLLTPAEQAEFAKEEKAAELAAQPAAATTAVVEKK